ncbi:DUF2182 domain-containing protein [Marinobacteraceae bacterium S3BR75-40.1]
MAAPVGRSASGLSFLALGGMAVIVMLCWWYLFHMAAGMATMTWDDRMVFTPWTPAYFLMMFLMWGIMMIAMMVPSAVPMILLYRRVALGNRQAGATLGMTLFVGGYLLTWMAFSLLATTLQWLLEQWALLSPMMRSRSLLFSGLVLLFAGIYQWSSLKQACLRHCRGSFMFISHHWRPGLLGAFRMGLVHGSYCIGCCGALMALLFVGGVMDLTVIALLAIVVLLEKVLPGGEWLARILGVLAFAAGLILIIS